MTREEYEQYQQQVAAFRAGVDHVASGPCPGCDECLELPEGAEIGDPSSEWCDLASEPHFSRSACDVCNSTLGGNRYPAHALFRDDGGREQRVHLDICEDCLMYLEYERLDDRSMAAMEAAG